ncbi:unnamed protein product [Darwinula stevensoni]|uniref:VLIG-type G domain-containing protein n=1 Tax=Darwinula stevensoni TaxID=69355 RepID=A0A7R9A2V9_9CRUS|nr:unnamed protein product [Darwinula stevensoni]CAG0890510.1 unnamed protein product [Darwinula stevensoni]
MPCSKRSSVGVKYYSTESESIQLNPSKIDRFVTPAMDMELQSCLGLRKFRKITLLEARSLSWTNELAKEGETPRRSVTREHPTPIIAFMQDVIATTGAYRHIDLPLPEKLRTESDETEIEEGEDGEEDNQENLNTMKIHPHDILTIALQNSEPSLRQLLLGRLFQMGHGMPVVLPVSPLATTGELRGKNLELLVWALRNTDVKYRDLYHSLVEFQAQFIGFIRVGSLHDNLSKSKVINEALFEKHDTFFHSELPFGEASRRVSNGIIEMAWAKISVSPGRETRDSDERGSVKPVFILNLRGDAAFYPTQVQLLGKICSLVVLFLGNDPTQSLEEGDHALSEVVSGLTYASGTKGARCTILKDRRRALPNIDRLRRNNPNMKFVNLQKVNHPIKAVRDEVCEAVTRAKRSKSPTNATDVEMLFAWKDVEEIINPTNSVDDVFRGVAIDMDSEAIVEPRALAEKCVAEFTRRETGSRKKECLPLSTGVLPNYAKNEQDKRKQNVIHGRDMEERQKSLRSKQVRYIKDKPGISQNLLNFVETLSRMSAEQITNSLFYLRAKLDNLSTQALNPLREKKLELLNISAKNDDMERRNERKLRLIEVEKKMRQSSLGIENIFRELAQIYECRIGTDDKSTVSGLPETMASMILDGIPLELLDGDNGYIPMTWLKAIFNCMKSRVRKIWVLSVIGIQSSGKSTMLNTIFGSDFLVRTGSCTKGVYMQFFPFQCSNEEGESPKDYLVLLDIEGLRAPEFSDDYSGRRDNELATFAIGLADLILLNVMGETPSDLKDFLPTALHGLIRMNEGKKSPNVVIIHQNVREDAHKSRLHGLKKMQEVLDEMPVAAAKEKDLLKKVRRFYDGMKLNLTEDTYYFPSLLRSGNLCIHSEEYGCKAKQMKSVILEKLRVFSGRNLNIFSRHLEKLWEAIMKEDFAFNFRNVMEMVA